MIAIANPQTCGFIHTEASYAKRSNGDDGRRMSGGCRSHPRGKSESLTTNSILLIPCFTHKSALLAEYVRSTVGGSIWAEVRIGKILELPPI